MAKKLPTTTESPNERIYRVWAWILLFWSLYRYFFHLPEWTDELLFKPLVFVAPILWFVRTKEKRPLSSLGLTGTNLFRNLYIGLGFGAIFALEGFVAHVLKNGDSTTSPIAAFQEYGFFLLFLSLATAFSEELLSRGFVFSRIYEQSKNLLMSALTSSVLFVCLHVPMLVTTTHLQGTTLIIFLVTDFILAYANSMLLAATGSLVAPVLVHLFWNMTVALFL